MPHSDHEWGEGVWLGGCGLQWSVLELCVLDFLGYVLWSFTTITEGAGGHCHDIVIGGGMPHSDHEWGEGAWLGGCGLQWSVPTLRSHNNRFPWLRIVVLYHYNGGGGRPLP